MLDGGLFKQELLGLIYLLSMSRAFDVSRQTIYNWIYADKKSIESIRLKVGVTDTGA